MRRGFRQPSQLAGENLAARTRGIKDRIPVLSTPAQEPVSRTHQSKFSAQEFAPMSGPSQLLPRAVSPAAAANQSQVVASSVTSCAGHPRLVLDTQASSVMQNIASHSGPSVTQNDYFETSKDSVPYDSPAKNFPARFHGLHFIRKEPREQSPANDPNLTAVSDTPRTLRPPHVFRGGPSSGSGTSSGGLSRTHSPVPIQHDLDARRNEWKQLQAALQAGRD